MSIDRRPVNGGLYGFGYNPTTGLGQLYFLSVRGAVANPVGSTLSFVDNVGDPRRVGADENTRIGIDFNPTVDRLRVVTSNAQNFRVNPNTGAAVDGDGGVAGTNMDGDINGGTTSLGETAYTNNTNDATVTTMYTLDKTTDSLFIQSPPNNGTQTGALNLTLNSQAFDAIEVRGFDILPGVNATSSSAAVTTGSGFAVLEFATTSQQRFCQIDLPTGAISNDSNIGDGTSELLGLALQGASATPDVIGLFPSSELVRFSSATPSTITSANISGLTAGETLAGIDFRPATGELMGLGVNATTDTATLYRVDPRTAAATALGSAVSITGLPDVSTGYGFTFNPTVDRIRVTTSTGLNFRMNPTDGTLTATDSALNGAATGANAVAYTNVFAGAAATTLYAIDAATNKLYIQNPPNAGTLTEVGALGVDFDAVAGFKIQPSVTVATSGSAVISGSGYAALTVGGVSGLYSINLTTGQATSLGTIWTGSTSLRGIALTETEAK